MLPFRLSPVQIDILKRTLAAGQFSPELLGCMEGDCGGWNPDEGFRLLLRWGCVQQHRDRGNGALYYTATPLAQTALHEVTPWWLPVQEVAPQIEQVSGREAA